MKIKELKRILERINDDYDVLIDDNGRYFSLEKSDINAISKQHLLDYTNFIGDNLDSALTGVIGDYVGICTFKRK